MSHHLRQVLYHNLSHRALLLILRRFLIDLHLCEACLLIFELAPWTVHFGVSITVSIGGKGEIARCLWTKVIILCSLWRFIVVLVMLSDCCALL